MIKVVFDTNIFISAILTPGNPRKLVDLARERKVMLFTSEFIIWGNRKNSEDQNQYGNSSNSCGF